MPKPKVERKLFEKCWGCDGTRKLARPVHVDYTRTSALNLPAGAECPLCENGYADIGMTVGQLESLREDRDRLLLALDDARQQTMGPIPGAVVRALEGRAAHVMAARQRLEKGR